jgi:hypothetical protein
MDLDRLISELHAERTKLDAAIEALGRIAAGNWRGRPPKWLAKIRDGEIEDIGSHESGEEK